MVVTLQLILGILLALEQCSTSNTANLRQIREAPPPSPSPIQNVTEINNRDLNKIVKDHPKTETVDSKTKIVNNVHTYQELPLKLATSKDEIPNDASRNKTEDADGSKEDFQKDVAKERRREESSRAIDNDAFKFWPEDYHSKNVPPDLAFEVTKHPSFQFNADLTTPTSRIFDQKFKETVESVEQNIEEDDHDEHENDTQDERNKDADLSVEDPVKKTDNESLEFLKTKAIVNNETVDKNSIHKDTNFEQTKKLSYESVFNDTKVYGEDTTKGETSSTERTTTSTSPTVSITTTRKSSILKELSTENSSTHILSNNIETETTKPVKGVGTSTTSSTTKKDREDLSDMMVTTAAKNSVVTTTESQNTTAAAKTNTPAETKTTITTLSTPIPNIPDQENHVIPVYFNSKSTPKQESSSDRPPTTEKSRFVPENTDKLNHTVESRVTIDYPASTEGSTTEFITSTQIPETTTIFDVTTMLSDGTLIPDEGTTIFIIENTTEISDSTTEMSSTTTEVTTIIGETTATENGHRTSKSLENTIVTEQMVKSNEKAVENITKVEDTSAESTVRNEVDSSTLNDERKTKTTENIVEKFKDSEKSTTENAVRTKVEDTSAESTVRNEVESSTLNDERKTKTTENIVDKFKDSEKTTTANAVRTKVEGTSAESTVRNEVESSTINDGRKTKTTENIVEKLKDSEKTTTENAVPTSTVTISDLTTFESAQSVMNNVTTQKEVPEATTETKTTVNSTEKMSEVPSTITEDKATTQKEESKTTTEYTFGHIETTNGTNDITLLPEDLSPSFNYTTTTAADNRADKIRKVVFDEHSTSSPQGSNSSTTAGSTTSTSTTVEPMVEVSATTAYEPETSTENSYSKDAGGGGDKGKIAAIAISAVGAVCLVLLAGLLYVMKKRQKRLNYGPRCRPVSLDDYSIDNLSVYNSVRRKGGARLSKRSFGNPAFEDPVAPTHPLNFPALAKFSTNYEDIKAEFEEIPQISARTSELPDGCETKNRYANVIPLPETRVFLTSIDGYPNSDYINGNYVTGPKNVKGYYIAAQAPMQNTVDDFWRMIWEQQAKVILMLTHLVENGLEKCVDYLPESEVIDCSRLFGDFQIILKKQEVKDKYIISTLQLKNMVSNSWREVTHFWYLGWPEKGVPAEGNSLIAFLIEARSYMKIATIDKRGGVNGIQNGGAQNEHNPVVVHCSPGTGRTGVAIACDIAIREFETTRLVDIPKIVYRIRRDRAGAVQTREQYIFIYKVVSLYATKLTGEALENF